MHHFHASAYIQSFTGPEQSKLRYDLLKSVAALQGLVNRDACRLYMTFMEDTDQYWLEKYKAQDGFLAEEGWQEVKDWDELLTAFLPWLNGIVLWDEAVPATSNVAATICGVERLLPVRYDPDPSSFYSSFIEGEQRLAVKRSLVGMFKGTGMLPGCDLPSSGSAKCDAYLWAKRNYLDTGLCDPKLLAYYLDAHRWLPDGEWYSDLSNTMVVNHDYYIARQAFFFDLSPWADELPGDDLDQPLGTDFQTMQEIMLSEYRNSGGSEVFTVGGFTPWYVKYTQSSIWAGKHEAVETEWRHAEIMSCYNAIMDADAYGLSGMANASIHRHYPLRERYVQSRMALTPPKPEKKVYVLFFMGDYDSAAWLNSHIRLIWDDPRRGELPLAWGFNPNLSDRVPQVFEYIYRTKTINDVLVSGDSGAGYLNPTHLLEPRVHSGLPSGMEAWVAHNKMYYERFDLTMTGFLLNGYEFINEEVQKAYARFSPDGVITQEYDNDLDVVDGTVFQQIFHNIGPYGTIRGAADVIYDSLGDTDEPQFIVYRTILVTPSFLLDTLDLIRQERPELQLEVLDPYSFFQIKKQYVMEAHHD